MSWQDDTMDVLEMQSKIEQKKFRECELFSTVQMNFYSVVCSDSLI